MTTMTMAFPEADPKRRRISKPSFRKGWRKNRQVHTEIHQFIRLRVENIQI